ncbi:MAG: hypothetical protein ABIR36_08960 [Nitrospiraceae bacterium]
MMESERRLAEYRARLLVTLSHSGHRSACDTSDSIQVFINERRAGLLGGAGSEARLQLQSQARIDNVHLRSEDGVLLGGLSAPEYGFRASRIPLMRAAVELRVQNFSQGGSVSAVFIPAPDFWHRTWQALTRVTDTIARRPATVAAPGMRTVAFTQALLAIALVGLAADRMTGWMTPERMPLPVTPTEAPRAASLAEMAKLEQQLGELGRLQAKTVDTIQIQQQRMAQLQRAMTRLSSAQETVASGMLTVKQDMEQRRKGSGQEVERMARMLMSKAQTEKKELEGEIHSLTIANDRLSKEVTQIGQNNQDLKKRLQPAGVDVSKAPLSDRDKPIVARQSELTPPPTSPQAADARLAIPQPSFLFWVAFSDGTSQETIDQWVREMQGHKGALSEGWQAVEIVPPTVPPDRFLDQIKHAKIVKAVRTSR